MEVKLVVVGGKHAGREFVVSVPEFLIGRGQECQLRLKSDVVSRRHCAVVVEGDVAVVKDFGSTNGTFLNHQRIEGRRELNSGDRISIGVLELEVQLSAGETGKSKPKIRTVRDAARTVASAGSSDWDITSWLAKAQESENEDEESVVAPVKRAPSPDDTVTGKGLTETGKVSAKTTALPASPKQNGAKTKGKTPTQEVSKFQKLLTPTTEDSGQAANEILRKFLSRKKT